MNLSGRLKKPSSGCLHPGFISFFLSLVSLLVGVGRAQAQRVIITWDPNEEPDLAGYRVHYGTASRDYGQWQDVGLVTEHTVTLPSDVGTYFFAVTAYDTAGNESGYSAEVAFRFGGSELETDGFLLMNNYPNPFNPDTRIAYFLPKRLSVTLAVYDLLGRRVKLLDEGEKEANVYEVVWDGTDEKGFPVANGIYFCRMVVGDFCQTRKLMLAR